MQPFSGQGAERKEARLQVPPDPAGKAGDQESQQGIQGEMEEGTDHGC